MNRDKGLKDKDAPSLENVHEMKLEALLHDLIRNRGMMQAARMLGVNYKTVSRSIEAGNLSVHLKQALMARLLIREEKGVGRRQRSRSLEQAVDRLAAELRDGLRELREEVRDGFTSMEETQDRGFERMSKQVPRMAIEPGAGDMASTSNTDRTLPRKSQPREYFRQTHPSLVTMDYQPGDEEVFGNAWPVVKEWRALRMSHTFKCSGIAWLEGDMYLKELEVVLIDDHEMTLPPETYPWDSLGRRDQVDWRLKTLARLRKELLKARLRRWARRILTLGIWRR